MRSSLECCAETEQRRFSVCAKRKVQKTYLKRYLKKFFTAASTLPHRTYIFVGGKHKFFTKVVCETEVAIKRGKWSYNLEESFVLPSKSNRFLKMLLVTTVSKGHVADN